MPPREVDRHCLSERHYHRTTSSPSRLGVVLIRPKEGNVGAASFAPCFICLEALGGLMYTRLCSNGTAQLAQKLGSGRSPETAATGCTDERTEDRGHRGPPVQPASPGLDLSVTPTCLCELGPCGGTSREVAGCCEQTGAGLGDSALVRAKVRELGL